MELTSLLSPVEMTAFTLLITEASAVGAGAVRYFSQSRSLAVIGICDSGELVTWFASPAKGNAELVVLQSVVLAGIAAAGTAYAKVQSDAQDAIAKASKKH
jgi:hypothetical protein